MKEIIDAETARQIEQFFVGGSFIAAFLFTKRMHSVYSEKIKKIEADNDKIIETLHSLEKNVVILSTKIDFLSKNLGGNHG